MPLHPIVVHFPIAGAVFALPLVLGVLWAVRTGRLARQAWLIPGALQFISMVGAFAALASGEDLEESVEDEQDESQIEAHEGHAQRLTAGIALGTVATVAAAFVPAAVAIPVEVAAVVLGAAGAGLAVPTGHSGGEMVWGDEPPADPAFPRYTDRDDD
ncbi:MAG: hypothetical protein FJ102_08990 [Deltaproteobacteria bacterium]|nr:hypothetical protein [Deltaproteobacteria bacterium]